MLDVVDLPTKQLDTSLVRCKGCPNGFAKIVGSRGPQDSPFVIVGESPGVQELKAGIPFVGLSGQVLEHALAQHPDIDPLILNAIQCFPGSTKTKSQDKVITATHACQERLLNEIKAHPRKVILALGNPAVWATTGEFASKITQIRGKLWQSPLAECGIVTTVHPAYLLRGSGSMRQFMADVDYACSLAKGIRTPDASGNGKRYIIPKIHIAQNAESIRWLANEIQKQQYVSVDCETGGYDGFDFLRDRILTVGYCWDPHDVYVIPEHLVKATRLIYRRAQRTKFIWHNGKFDQKFHWVAGIPECRVDEDTMLLSYALDETKGIHDLEQLTSDILGAPDWKFMIKEYLNKASRGYDTVPKEILYDYMSRDISSTLQIFPFLRNCVRQDPHLEKLYTKTLLLYSNYLARIETKGMLPNLEQVAANQKEKTKIADSLEAEFNCFAVEANHGMLNPRSPQQVAAFLYDTLKLRDPRYPKKIPASTDEKTLLTLEQLPVIKCLLKYREVQKALGTYVNSVAEHVGADGRIHCGYLIHGTTSGRLASRNPNLLNIPRDPPLRDQFQAADGRIYMDIDVNQAELRVLAELSGDPTLYYIYTTPGAPSIHLVTQREMFGDPSSYTDAQVAAFMEKFSTQGDYKRTLDEQNMRAKCVNFGIVYGRTAPSIAEEFRIPIKEAQEWIDKWFKKYSVAREFILQCRSAPLKGQNLVTPFGRKRRFQIVNRERLNDIQNQAANFPEQSIASDCVAHTGMRVQQYAKEQFDADIVNTVYDSLLFELPNDMDKAFELGTYVLKTLRQVPREWGITHVPFVGDLKIGTRWGSLKKTPLPPNLQAEVDAT